MEKWKFVVFFSISSFSKYFVPNFVSILTHQSNWNAWKKWSDKIPLNWLTSIAFKTWPAWTSAEIENSNIPRNLDLQFSWIGKWAYEKNDPRQITSLSVERFEYCAIAFVFNQWCLSAVDERTLFQRKKTKRQARTDAISCLRINYVCVRKNAFNAERLNV